MYTLDIFYILRWFLSFFLIGVVFLPLTFSLFKDFRDKGYIFSKIIGLAFISYFVFIISLVKLIKFSEISIYLAILIFFIINYVIKRTNILKILRENIKLIVLEEVLFLAALLFWSFIRSNFPDINGLEKFMDFGFLNSILRADYFPPKDMWYTPLPINYYYFGHLITAVITKLTSIPSFISYNLMLATLFALTLSASLSIAINIFNIKKITLKSVVSGIFTSAFVAFAGNLTTIYAFFKAYPNEKPVPFWDLKFLFFNFPNGYWYPNATRFIPFTIHEFPIYSFVVSDLHGHVLDIPFVLLIIASCFSIFISKKITKYNLIFLSFILSIMYMTNAWDGLIYLLLISLLFIAFYTFKEGEKSLFSNLSLYELTKKVLTVLLGFIIFSIPFSIHFKPFVSGVGVLCAPSFLTKIGKIGPFLFEADHCQKSPIWQLMLLYGFFYFFVISFLIFIKFKKDYKISKSDIFILILTILSSLLIIIPEFLYIKDIYPVHYRANTMFKLTYEAFIMLSICSGYMLVKIISNIKNKLKLILFFIASFALISLVIIYPYFAINSYYRGLATYHNLDGTIYLSSLYPNDYKLINWINQNIKGQPVILEASGDSYTNYARISANTGIPTVIGWSVHEWLWRGSYDIVAPRIEDVKNIYTYNDINIVKNLIRKYNVSYVVVSSLEKEKYPNLNEENFKLLGKIIYKSNLATLYKIN